MIDVRFLIAGFLVLALLCVGVGVASGYVAEGVDIARQNAESRLIDAQSTLVEKQTENTQAQAELTEAIAHETEAQGDLILKKGQAKALNDTVTTSNNVITWLSTIIPAAPPFYLSIGVILGGAAFAGVGYAIGFKNGVNTQPQTIVQTVVKEPEPVIPEPVIVGNG